MSDNKYRRAIDHLTQSSSPERVIGALQAVEDLFTASWLEKKDGHRLQILWARRDTLSTSELYSLGKSILKLSVNSRRWLEANAREIRKDINNSHGLLTEIITIGNLSAKGGTITPCTKSYPLYDYTVDFETGYQYKVSVKNFDISIHEKNFNKQCNLIRTTFKNFLKRKKDSGYLTVILERDVLTEDLARVICCHIAFQLDKHDVYLAEDGRFLISFNALSEYEGKGLVHPSDIVLIIGRQHHNEQRNIKDKIKQAHDKLSADPDDDKSLKKLLIRLGTTTNIDLMHEYMQELASDWERCGFDMYLLVQPAVVSDLTHNTTMIVNTIYTGSKSFYPKTSNFMQKMVNLRPITWEIGVGGISQKRAPLLLMAGKASTNIDLSESYVFQKGDIYLRAEREGDTYMGDLSRMAPGILLHSVVDNMILSPVCFATEDNLLIV